MSRLDGRTVVLTGAAGGIGTLLAERLRAAGARVVGVDRVTPSACDEPLVADLASPTGLASIAKALVAREVHILINAAGVQYFGPLDQQEPESIASGYAVNLVAPAVLIRAVLPGMLTRGEGQIVNIGSVMGTVSYPYFAAYSSAKAGLKALSEAVRREVGDLGVHVTHISPRAVATAFNSAAVNQFIAAAGMTADAPSLAADRICAAIIARRKDVVIGRAERFYGRLNAVLPRVVDAGLSGQVAKARRLIQSHRQGETE